MKFDGDLLYNCDLSTNILHIKGLFCMSLTDQQRKRLQENIGVKYEKRKKLNHRLRVLVLILVIVPIVSLFIDLSFALLALSFLAFCWVALLLNKVLDDSIKKQSEKQLKMDQKPIEKVKRMKNKGT